ncbi:MAG: hypothetical protein ABIB46_03545 [bacterium]
MALEKEKINEEEINLLKYVNIILKRRKVLCYLFIIMLPIFIFILFFFISNSSYTITTVFMPLANFYQIQRLENLSGVSQYEARNSFSKAMEVQLYLCERNLRSEKIIIQLLEKKYLLEKKDCKLKTLTEIFKIKDFNLSKKEILENVCEIFKKSISIKVDSKRNLITLSFVTKYPYFGKNLVNDLLNELSIILKEQDFYKTRENQFFIEKQLKESEKKLINVENILYEFREKNRIINTPDLKLQEEKLIRDLRLEESLFTMIKKESELSVFEKERVKEEIIVLEKPVEKSLCNNPKNKKSNIII